MKVFGVNLRMLNVETCNLNILIYVDKCKQIRKQKFSRDEEWVYHRPQAPYLISLTELFL